EMLKPLESSNQERMTQPIKSISAWSDEENNTYDARINMVVNMKSVEFKENIRNYGKEIGLIYNDQGKVCGITAKDELNGETFDIHAKKVINAGGPWVDELRELNHSKKGKTLQLTKGTHLVFSQEVFPLQQAIYFDTHDKRMIFAIPRE